MAIKWLIIAIIVIVVIYLWQNKIVFRIDTLFRKGFKKINDSYRRLLLGTVNNGDR